ncbi:MAG TPA: hypothetical protein VIL46_09765 [Gemmataceae bacterium]
MPTPHGRPYSLPGVLIALLLLPAALPGAGRGETDQPGVRLPVPPEALPANYQEAVRRVLASPTLSVRAEGEAFHSPAELYHWLLDHPDRVSLAWQRIGVGCLEILSRPDGQFRWRDGQGTEVVWRTIARGEHGRVWYAHGQARAGALLPAVPARAVAVLWHRTGLDEQGRPVVRHQLDLYLQTDSKAARLVARMLGPAAPRLAEDGAQQLLMFFSGIARYLARHPEQTRELLAPQ